MTRRPAKRGAAGKPITNPAAEPPTSAEAAAAVDDDGGAAESPAEPQGEPARRPSRRASDGSAADGPGAGAARRPGDRMLAQLLMAAERNVRLRVTLQLGSTLVTGTLIGGRAYAQGIADRFASSHGGTAMDEILASDFRDYVDDLLGVGRGDRRDPPDPAAYERASAFVHLEDARCVTATGVLPHGRRGLLWRVAVADVAGWGLGELLPD